MYKSVELNKWKMALVPDSRVKADCFCGKTVSEIINAGYTVIDAKVPGNFELDMAEAGLIDKNIYYGTNVLKLQNLEDTHLWYFCIFGIEKNDDDVFLEFEGIDTASEIFVDGNLLGKTENMFISHSFCVNHLDEGLHELVVHIIPASVYVKDKEIPSKCRALKYNIDSLAIRKAPYMYGWDIMPRMVSAGIWKEVKLYYKPVNRIDDFFIVTSELNSNKAVLTASIKVSADSNILNDYYIEIKGVCGNSEFRHFEKLFTLNSTVKILIDNPKLWWPKNYGEPNLYNVNVSLYYKKELCDNKTVNFGVRTVKLDRTSLAGKDGKFHFEINGKKVFVMGTNWVPTDAFPSRHDKYLLRGLEMVNDLNCNMIRCWGGNVYPSEELYQYCDRHGIMVWQDFAMACGIYPDDERFCALLRQEVVTVVKKLRNYSCIVLWSGDNECDQSSFWNNININGETVAGNNPNSNILTRRIIPEVLNSYDYSRPYLPSSPYLDDALLQGGSPAEDHLWGPRDYFKGDFYKNSVCHFVSETGYHGCPSPATLREFIPESHLTDFTDNELCRDEYWLVHSASPETDPYAPYAYRIPLMTKQIERLFGTAEKSIYEYALQSQISQAEADKFMIEHFRTGKWYRTGILWWNIIDGWAQISDAVVDWFGRKKLAYSYIKRSQQPFCIMCDEPKEGMLPLCAANDTRDTVTVRYKIKDGITDKTILIGECTVAPDLTVKIGELPDDGTIYLINWENSNICGKNHYTSSLGEGIKLEEYVAFLKKSGFYSELQGF